MFLYFSFQYFCFQLFSSKYVLKTNAILFNGLLGFISHQRGVTLLRHSRLNLSVVCVLLAPKIKVFKIFIEQLHCTDESQKGRNTRLRSISWTLHLLLSSLFYSKNTFISTFFCIYYLCLRIYICTAWTDRAQKEWALRNWTDKCAPPELAEIRRHHHPETGHVNSCCFWEWINGESTDNDG